MAWSHPKKQKNTYLDLYSPSRKEEGSYSSSLGVGATLGIRSVLVLRSSHRNPLPFTPHDLRMLRFMITNCLVLYNTHRWGHSQKCGAERTLLLHCPRPVMLGMLSPRALPWHIRPEIIQSFSFAWSFSIIDLL
jgi:hypothetical protein